MKNQLFCILTFALLLKASVTFSQKSDTPSATSENGRENWVLPYGNVGLNMGKDMATERLHINGNARVNQTIFANSLEAPSIKIGTINANQGTFSQGLTAANTVINGTLNVSGLLTGQGSSFTDVTISNNLSINNGLTVTGLSLFNGGAKIGATSTLNNVHVDGTFQAQAISISSLSASGDATIGKDLNVAGTAFVNGAFTVNGAMNAQSLSLTDLNAANTISIGNTLNVSGLGNLTGGANIGGNSTINNLAITGSLTAGTMDISEIDVTGEVKVGENLNVIGAGQFGGDLSVAGFLNAKELSLSNVTVTNDIAIGNGLAVLGSTQLKGGALITGSSTITGDLRVTGALTAGSISLMDINSNGSATITENLTVSGLSQFGGDLEVTGNIKGAIIEGTEFRSPNGSALTLENAKINNTLSIASDRPVPSNYRLAVGGNIIATGIDIKVPQKWPDYVFTDGHKLLTIAEVEAFIAKHGHLPGVLSATEMETKHDYSVAEMDAKLMEKVEELTLYIIQLKKEIEELKKK